MGLAGTRLSTLVAPAHSPATLPDAHQACWAWWGQRAGPAAPGSHPRRGHGHRVTASECLPLDRVETRGLPGQGQPESEGSRSSLEPCLCCVDRHPTAARGYTSRPGSHGLPAAGCPAETPGSSVRKGTTPPDPARQRGWPGRLPACGQLRSQHGAFSLQRRIPTRPKVDPGTRSRSPVAVPGAWRQEAPAGRRRGEQHPRGQKPPGPCGGSGHAQRGCPLSSRHRQWASGPASEAALGWAPPLPAQTLEGGGSLFFPRVAHLHIV